MELGRLPPVLRYQSIVGTLMYLAHSTRVDIACAVNQLSRATHYARYRDLVAAEHCVRFLLGTANQGLHFAKGHVLTLKCFVDANYFHDGSQMAITGLILMLGGGPVYWTARKQDKITTSSCDAESYATQTAVQYVEYARHLLEELGCIQMQPTPVYNDNTATVKLCIDPVAHKKSVQMTRAMAYVRERYAFGVIQPLHVRTKDQPADFLTKRLSVTQFGRCSELTGMAAIPKDRSKGS